MADIKKALLFINQHKMNAQLLAEEICGKLNRNHIETYCRSFTGTFHYEDPGPYDIAFSLGGDGTVLYAARSVAPLGVPILPVNLGTLGFIASVPPDEWALVFNFWTEKKITVSRRLMLEVTVERNRRFVSEHVCLNDAVVSASGTAKVIYLRLKSGSTHLGKYRSDGLIVATPTGSTAYSVSAGGPILDPEMKALIINPICPFTLSNRPIVVPGQEAVVVEIEEEQRSAVLLTLDGQVTEALEPGDRVYIKQAAFEAKLIASDRNAFYQALRTKLSWSGGPDA
jgi:NAD+ kinase